MLAPIATLVFLAAIWLTFVVAAEVIESRLHRIAAAFRGEAPPQTVELTRVRTRSGVARRSQPLRARPEWRAAA
jgi:hypothetical protein